MSQNLARFDHRFITLPLKRDLVVRRTTKHSKKLPKGVCKNQHLGVY
jgi:hypothetical protein